MRTAKYLATKRRIPATNYGFPNYGSLGTKAQDHNYISWYSCRDTYQRVDEKSIIKNGIFFCHGITGGDNVAIFLNLIEKRLKLRVKSKFAKTNNKDIIWVKVSPWWLKTKIRKSFLTMTLRTGTKYNQKETVRSAFNKPPWKTTLPAILFFLKGNAICPVEDGIWTHGWMHFFSGKKTPQIKKMLVKR